MKSLTATYHNGTLTLHEPIDLPDGIEVQLNIEDIESVSPLSSWDQQIHRESEHFIRQHAILLRDYKGEYVAMHEGLVIDHDPDKRALASRIREKWHATPILIRLVTGQPYREVVIRSPRVERKG